MNARWILRSLIMALHLIALGFFTPGAHAQQLPKGVSIGTNTPGTLFYSLASGLAKVASSASPVQVSVQPYTGTSTFLPLVNNGELDFGVVNGVDMGMAYMGPTLQVGGRNPFPHSPNTRLVMRGSPLRTSAVVKKDSRIRSLRDVKGKRVTGEYPAHLAVWYNMFGILASAGLTWNDVQVVPVPAVNEGIDALVQGRADVSTHALGSAKMKEADAAVGVRYISIDCSPEGEKRMRSAVPGHYPTKLKDGASTGVLEETCFQTYDIYFATHKAASDPLVTAVLKALWDNIGQLKPLHPGFAEWTHERAASAEMTIPYHPAAIKFYREKDVWKPNMDQAQQRLLAQN